ncbi:MAG TPA: alpha/beta hydrolase [Gemmatimonadales bacterium]|nr:alpha/beta hydrolase [Gemmatimonadales bacterium]
MSGRIGRLARRIALALGAAVLLWAGFGSPRRSKAPFHAQWVDADGVRSRALLTGRGDTTLVFLHGYGESLLSWRALLEQFTRRYRVVALDLPGFGQSRSPGFGYSYPDYAEWLDSVLAKETRGPLVLVGHSMGGELAAGYTIEHPDRVVAAVLIAPAGAGINPLFADSGSIASPAAEWVTAAFAFVVPPEDTTWLREPRGVDTLRAAIDSSRREAVPAVLRRFDFAALEHRYADLKQPVLLIWGDHDPTIPIEIGQRIAAVLPCRRFVRLFTLHRPHQTLPDTVAAEMRRFLQGSATRCEQ